MARTARRTSRTQGKNKNTDNGNGDQESSNKSRKSIDRSKRKSNDPRGSYRYHCRPQKRLVNDNDDPENRSSQSSSVRERAKRTTSSNKPNSRTRRSTWSNETHSQQREGKNLTWVEQSHFVPVDSEKRMIPLLILAGKEERGMFKDQPLERLHQICERLNQDAPGFTLHEALSFRRTYMKFLNPSMAMNALGLGKESHIRKSANIFEGVLETYLRQKRINFWTESEQRRRKDVDGKTPLTPDFLLHRPVQLRICHGSHNNCLRTQNIHWVEAKMFYGASTIPQGTNNAVGCVLSKMKAYVERFGPGAIVFMQGCGDQLAAELASANVAALTAAALPDFLLEKVQKHQKKWCAKDGQILP